MARVLASDRSALDSAVGEGRLPDRWEPTESPVVGWQITGKDWDGKSSVDGLVVRIYATAKGWEVDCNARLAEVRHWTFRTYAWHAVVFAEDLATKWEKA